MNFAFPPLSPAVRVLLSVLFGSVVAQTVLGAAGVPLFDWLGLHAAWSSALAWQWCTYPLVELPGPGSVVDRALDLMLLYFWLAGFEGRFGARATLLLAALAVTAGAACVLLVGFAWPSVSHPFAGASPIAWAGLAALAVTTRGRPMQWLFLPQMNAWGLALVFLLVLSLQCTWAGTATPLAGALGGFAAGVAYTRWLTRPRPPAQHGPYRRRPAHLKLVPEPPRAGSDGGWLN